MRPEGRIVKILKGLNKEKEHAIPIGENIPKIVINVRNITKKLIQPNEISKSNYNINDFEKDYVNYKKNIFQWKYI